MFIRPPESSPAIERMQAENSKQFGFVMNFARAWAWRPDVFDAFAALRNQLTGQSTLTKRDQAVIISAMASQLGDAYCSLAWGKTLAAEAGGDVAAAVLGGSSGAALNPRDAAIAAWSRKLVDDPNGTTQADIDALRKAGLDDRAIFEVTVFAAFRLAFSTVNDALGVAPDPALVDLVPQEVRGAVQYGRPARAFEHGTH